MRWRTCNHRAAQVLSKAINKHIESEIAAKSGSKSFRVLKPEQTAVKHKQLTSTGKLIKHVLAHGKVSNS